MMGNTETTAARRAGAWRAAPPAIRGSIALWVASILAIAVIPDVRRALFGDSGGSIVIDGPRAYLFVIAWQPLCFVLLLRGWRPARYILTLLGGVSLLGALQPLTPQIVVGFILTAAAMALMWLPSATAFIHERGYRIVQPM